MVVAVVLGATVTSGIWGAGVFGKLSQGGYDDPASQSAQVANLVTGQLGHPAGDVVVVYTAQADRKVDDPAITSAALAVLHALPRDAVRGEVSYWDTHAPRLAAANGTRAIATITLNASNATQQADAYARIKHSLDIPGLTSQVGGAVPTNVAISDESSSDLELAEAVSLPITLILLLLIFGSVVAAALPVMVGGLAIVGSLGVVRLISMAVDVNSFAVNVVSLLGLGLAIDYGLFTVGRFREELAAGRSSAEAVRATMATSGRTVAFSATLLVIALAGLLIFPLGFLRSMAYGGMSAVAIAALISVTLLPAVLGLLGHRVDKLALPWPRRSPTAVAAGSSPVLRRIADAVLRKPIRFAVPIVAILLALAAPFLSVRFGATDEKQLPPGSPTRQVAETISTYFPASSENGAQVLVRGANAAEIQQLTQQIRAVPGVTGVSPGGGNGDLVLLNATLAGDPLGDTAEHAVTAIRAIPAPAGEQVLVGGFSASVVDSTEAVVSRVPLMIGILVAATLVLMFLAFGSVLLPIKAVLMSVLSLSATFGVLVAVFQLGHGAGLLDVTPEPVQPGMLVLIGAVVFGLSTDYETFLLSRMVEARESGMSTPGAVRTGLLRTGRMISSAALLLIVVTGAFGLSQLQTMRFLGVGMIVALLLDATVVRMLLVPAVLRLLGNAAWWAPARLRRWRLPAEGGSDPAELGGPVAHDDLLDTERDGQVEQQRRGAQALR
ncbi:MAG TPA: MMPL family transporter [Pseudonocardiaceae bacterium]|nr:MMPL family transporter [Pseudonocardiaceae bacterium]